MKEHDTQDYFRPDHLKHGAYLSFAVSTLGLLLQSYFFICMCILLGIVWLIIASKWRKQPEWNSLSLIASIVLVTLGVVLSLQVIASLINCTATEKTMCGTVDLIHPGRYKTKKSFRLTNEKQEIRFKSRLYQSVNIQQGTALCVRYSHQPKWSVDPYVHDIQLYSATMESTK